MKKDFSISEVIGEARNIIRNNFWQVVGQYFLISFGLTIVFWFLLGRAEVLGSIIVSFVAVLWVLSYVNYDSFSFENIFKDVTFKKFIYFIFAELLMVFSIIGGLILLIIPGIVFAVRLIFVKFIAVDQNLLPMDALRESKRITKGVRWKLFWFIILMLLLNILGFICLIVGVFYTAPLTALSFGILYKKLSAMSSENETNKTPDAIVVETIEVVEA